MLFFQKFPTVLIALICSGLKTKTFLVLKFET